ncbi:MAG TPA: hypothetical protein VMF61_11110 [Candidatus Acidoferrales bacterium]|nr:hypothetical protein [Candidatus Acidoferrales bacterium]
MTERPAPFPAGDLHAALPAGHEGHAAIDRLHDELVGEAPSRAAVREGVAHLRGIPELTARIETWFEVPLTQRFVSIIDSIGL